MTIVVLRPPLQPKRFAAFLPVPQFVLVVVPNRDDQELATSKRTELTTEDAEESENERTEFPIVDCRLPISPHWLPSGWSIILQKNRQSKISNRNGG